MTGRFENGRSKKLAIYYGQSIRYHGSNHYASNIFLPIISGGRSNVVKLGFVSYGSSLRKRHRLSIKWEYQFGISGHEDD